MNIVNNDTDFTSRNRLKILKEKDLDKLQEDFLKTTNDNNICVKISKTKNLPKEEDILIGSTNSKKEPQKLNKKRDIIKLDFDLTTHHTIDNNLRTSNKNESSIFKINIMDNKEKLIIDRQTGLPNTFEVDTKKNLIDIKEKIKKEDIKIKKDSVSMSHSPLDKILNLEIKDDDYKKIHQKNLEMISSMSKEELIEYKQTIESKIPLNLIEKMKKGFFQKKLSNEQFKAREIVGPELDESDDEYVSNEEQKLEPMNNKIDHIITESNLFINNKGEIKYMTSIDRKDDNFINYSNNTFEEINLSTKFFSLKEINNLLMSSNDQQIMIGLKLSRKLMEIYLTKNLEIPSNTSNHINYIQEMKLWNKFYFLISHKNISVKYLSLSNLIELLDFFFIKDIKNFKHNLFYYNNLPCIKSTNVHPNTFLCNLKKELILLFTNSNENSNDFGDNITKNGLFSKQFLISANIQQDDEKYYLNCFKFIHYCFYLSNSFSNDSNIFLKYFHKTEFEYIFMEYLKKYENKKYYKFIVKILVIILLNCSQEKVEEYFELFSSISKNKLLLTDCYLNFIRLIKIGKITEEYILSMNGTQGSNKIIYQNIRIKSLNSNDENFQLLIQNLNCIKFDPTHMTEFSRYLLTKIKIFKSIKKENDEDIDVDSADYKLVNSNIDLNYLQEIIKTTSKLSISDELLEDNSLELNAYFDLWNTIFIFTNISYKYPKSINYSYPVNINDLVKPIEIFLKYYSEKIANIGNDESAKINYLYIIENFTKMCLNLLKCLHRAGAVTGRIHEKTFTNILINLPLFFNSHSEFYYYKFLKFINLLFNRKIHTDKHLEDFLNKIKFSYDSLLIDLNLYLGSNESLLRSENYKKFLLNEEEIKIEKISYSIGDNCNKSKFLPFSQHFITQILFNDKIYSEVKLNYLVLLIVILYKNPEYVNFNYLEIIFKTLIKFKDVINNNKAEIIISEFIHSLVLSFSNVNIENQNKFDMLTSKLNFNKNKDNEIIMEMYYNKLEMSIDNENEVSFYYKFLFILIIFFHNKNNQYSIENLNYLVYSNFIQIYNSNRLDQISFIKNIEEANFIINDIINNLTIKNLDLYETLIMSYVKYDLLKSASDNNLLIILIKKLIKYFDLKESNLHQIYASYINGSRQLNGIILEKLNKI